MLDAQLIDLLNSGSAWGLVGAGCSADAGLPTWDGLATMVSDRAARKHGAMPGSDARRFQAAFKANRLADAFDVLKKHYSSAAIDIIIAGICNEKTQPGATTKEIARWPFRAYITTNFDHLLEAALEPFGGWVPVGNTVDENAKISSDTSNIVWHPHGGAALGPKSLRLVVATSDYGEVYPAGSPTASALEALARMRTIVFLGFGFRDPDFDVLLTRVGRLARPGHPAYAFLANCGEAKRNEYRSRYSLEVIPYFARGSDHSELFALLQAYGAFLITRDIHFVRRPTTTPDYHDEVTALLTHNRLVTSCQCGPELAAQDCAIRSFLLVKLLRQQVASTTDLVNALPQRSRNLAPAIINQLEQAGTITRQNEAVALTEKGRAALSGGAAEAGLMRDQFVASIRSRIKEVAPSASPQALGRIRATVVDYLEDTCRSRGLGVAQNLAGTDEPSIRARTVALLQGIREKLEQCSDVKEGLIVIRIVQELLSEPNDQERQYLGILIQAHFGRHFLSAAWVGSRFHVVYLLANGVAEVRQLQPGATDTWFESDRFENCEFHSAEHPWSKTPAVEFGNGKLYLVGPTIEAPYGVPNIQQAVGMRPEGSQHWTFRDHAWTEMISHEVDMAADNAGLYGLFYLGSPYMQAVIYPKRP